MLVDEPSVEETAQILRVLSRKYGEYHDVEYDDDALLAAAKLSARYLPDRKLPDKARALSSTTWTLSTLFLTRLPLYPNPFPPPTPP